MHPNIVRQIKVEAIHLNELDGALRSAQAVEERIAVDPGSFQEKLRVRTDYMAEILGIQLAVEKLCSRLKLIGLFTCAICLGLGFIATVNAFDSQDKATVNFYWLILVLTGFNLLSMIVWCTALLLNYRAVATPSGAYHNQSGALFSLTKWLMNLLARSKQSEMETSTLQAWVRVYNDSGLSKWSLSKSSHLFWLCYLSGGLFMVLVMLSVREYNFGWATTILQPETFIGLTQLLSSVPDALGLDTPTREMIAASRLDTLLEAGTTVDQQAVLTTRSSWATLLISSLVFYGMLPRLGLLFFCHWKVKKMVQNYAPDYNQPYFLDLRHRLMPVTRSLGIIDPNEDLLPAGSVAVEKTATNSLPEDAQFLSIELAADDAWPPANIEPGNYLGDADDSESQQRALSAVADLNRPLVCAVSLMRSPDRGTARFIKELIDHCPTSVFLLIYGEFSPHRSLVSNDSVAGLRLSDWHRLANDLTIPDNHLIHLQR